MSAAAMPPVLPDEVESLLATLMTGAEPVELQAGANRLEKAVAAAGEIGEGALGELRSAIELIRGGQPCAAVSALLAARAALPSSRA